MPAYWLGSSMYNYICIELEYNNNNNSMRRLSRICFFMSFYYEYLLITSTYSIQEIQFLFLMPLIQLEDCQIFACLILYNIWQQ